MPEHLTCSRSSNDTHSLPGPDVEGDILKHQWTACGQHRFNDCIWFSRVVSRHLPSEYCAQSFSALRLPLAGQYAGGLPSSDDWGSWSMTRKSRILSALLRFVSVVCPTQMCDIHTCLLGLRTYCKICAATLQSGTRGIEWKLTSSRKEGPWRTLRLDSEQSQYRRY